MLLTPLITEAVKMLESTLPSSVEIHTNYAAGLPQVNIDPVHLEQIVLI